MQLVHIITIYDKITVGGALICLKALFRQPAYMYYQLLYLQYLQGLLL